LSGLLDTHADGSFDAEIVDEKGNIYMTLRGYRTMELTDPQQADLITPIQKALKA
jgi:hypothetical protein